MSIKPRVGLYIRPHIPGDGGVYSFQHSLLEELQSQPFRREVTIFGYDQEGIHPDVRLDERDLLTRLHRRWPERFNSPLQRSLQHHDVDLMWFIDGYEPQSRPMVVTVFDLQHRIQPIFPEVREYAWRWEARERFYSATLPRAAAVVVGTQRGREEVMQFYGIPEERIHILPLPTPRFALDAARKKPALSVEDGMDHRYLVYPAQFWPHKNHILLLELLKLRKERRLPNIRIVCCGEGKENRDYILRRARELQVIDQLQLLDLVSEQKLVQLYQSAAALVYPSYFGPDNLPPLEACALRCPLIVADRPGVREQLGDAALYFDPTSTESLNQRVEELFNSQELRAQLRDQGELLANSRTTERYIGQMADVVLQLEPYLRCWDQTEKHRYEA